MSPALDSLERIIENMAGEPLGSPAFLIQARVGLDIVYVLCGMCLLSAILASKEEAVFTTCWTHRNPLLPDRSFNMDL